MTVLRIEKKERVAVLRLHRPEKKNALSRELFAGINAALDDAAADDAIGVVMLTGGEDVFSAGGDLSEMAQLPGFAEAYLKDGSGATWRQLADFKKPLLAAVAGPAFGGGCELAMACDIIYAADNAQFGQPEVLIGAMPGGGGTQRLIRAVGKSLAMEICLGGRRLSAEEALTAGLVSRIVPAAELHETAFACAVRIAALSLPLLCLIKESVNFAQHAGLGDGLRFERRLFQSAFALADRQEGMQAFLEKRKPQFRHR